MRLQTKILAGYLVLVAVICSMAAILVHERGRMREIEAEAGEIQEIRRDITVAQRSITTLATLGEGVIGWEEADYRHYRIRRLRTDSLLQAMKPRCKDFVRPAQIDTLRALLVEKEAHLLHLMETFARQDKADSLLVNHLPEVAKRATRVRTVTQKKKGIAGAFGGKKTVQILPSAKELHQFSDSLIAMQQERTTEMEAYTDSLRTLGRRLNAELNRLITELDGQAQEAFVQKERKIAEAQALSVRLFTATISAAIILLFLSYLAIHRELKRNADEKKKREKLIGELQKSNDANEKLIRLRRNLIQNVTHELRTPLTVIGGNAELLLNDTEADNRMRHAQTIGDAAGRMDNLLFRLEYGHSLPEWADNDTSLQDDMEWLMGQPSETYAQAVERAAGLCLREENALRRLLWQTGNEKLQADIFSAAMTLPIALQDKRRFLVLALDARPDIVLGFVHGSRDDDSLRDVADLLESPSVAVIMRTETENHAEVDLPAYWHYLYEWLIRYYPYEGVAMFGGKAEFTRHLHFRLLTFIRKRRYSFYLSKAELTVDFLQEVFGQAYYIDVLNAIYGLQPHNADGSPVHDGYFNLELYRTFLRLSLLRLPTDAAHADTPAGTRDENGQPDMTARRQGAIIGGETSIWRNAKDFIKWIKDTSVPESHRQAVVRMIAAEHPDEWIAILKILPAEGNGMDVVADSLSAHILLQGIGRKNFYQAAVLERAIGRIQTNAGKYPFLSRGGTALQASLSKALLLFMQDENTLGRTLTEAEILERFLKHLYSAHTGRTDSEGYAAWHQLAADMKDETGTGAPETADAASGIQTEELPRDPEELLEQIRRSVAQDKLAIGQWSERLGTAYLKWLAANYCLSASDLLRQVIEAMQVDESTERAVWAAALIKDKGKAWLYNTRRENVRSFVETICGLQGKDKAETEDAVKRITDVTAPMEDMDTPIDDTPQDVTTVDNAGLCLLAPWFVRLFDMLGYLDGERKAFKDTASKVRAVFLLQYLACGKEEEWREPDLAFNRLLTALPGYVPLPGRMELTDEERQTADSMVQGVKANWREMDGTSVEGFRQSFILRDGMLEEEEHHWTLTVADKPYDILLDTVPWGFRQIRLPWLKKYVQVAWHEKQEF